jgi:hypothetical protein
MCYRLRSKDGVLFHKQEWPCLADITASSVTAGTDKISIQSSLSDERETKSTATIRIDSLRMQLINKMAHLQITSLDDAATSLDTH